MICLETVKKFCKNYAKIENYDKAMADTTQTWECHHRLECIETGAVVNSSRQDLIDWGIYYDRPADELIFLTASEHIGLHNRNQTSETKERMHIKLVSRITSEETKKKQSEAAKRRGYNKPKDMDAFKRKLSEANKGKKLSEEQKRKISEAHKGKKNSDSWKEKMIGRKWFTDGNVNVRQFECPEGFWKGMTRGLKDE